MPAVQHGSCVGEADEHVRRGRGPVQAVQLVPYVVRGHDGAAGVSERLDAMRNETKTQSENHSCELSPSFTLTDIVCPPSAGLELTKLKGEDFFERGERALASPPLLFPTVAAASLAVS